MKIFNNIKIKLFICFFSLMLFCCSQEDIKKEEVSECRQLTAMIEDCMGLHRGALNYLEDCGSLKLEEANSYETCEELLEYVGLDDFKI